MPKKLVPAFFISQVIVLIILLITEVIFRYAVLTGPNLVHPKDQLDFDRGEYNINLAGQIKFSVNSLGLRGDELQDSSAFKVLVFGASGAMGWMLDDKETWPHLLQNELLQEKKPVWVGNAAQLGNRMVESHEQLRHLLNYIKDVDLIVVVGSGVDLQVAVYQDSYFVPNLLKTQNDIIEARERAFAQITGPFDWTHWATWQWLKNRTVPLGRKVKPTPGFFNNARKMRAEAKKFLPEAPSLEKLFVELSFHQQAIANLAQNSRAQLIFVTRPTLWKEIMSPVEQDLLWVGFGGNHQDKFPNTDNQETYFTYQAMYHAFEKYNQQLMKNCEGLKSYCFDLSSTVPKTIDNFFDDSHLTPQGSVIAAKSVFEYINKNRGLLGN